MSNLPTNNYFLYKKNYYGIENDLTIMARALKMPQGPITTTIIIL